MGNTDDSSMLQVAGSLGAGYIGKDIMETSLRGAPIERSAVPPGLRRGRVCSVIDLFIAGTAPARRRGPATVAAGRGARGPRRRSAQRRCSRRRSVDTDITALRRRLRVGSERCGIAYA